MRLAICSSKGGVGKTTTAANLVAVLAGRGRTLAVDADPQESLGRSFGVVAGSVDSLAGLLDPEGEGDTGTAIRREVLPGLDVLPAHPSLERVGTNLAEQGGLTTSLRRALRPLHDRYDHIVIDTHGDNGNLTLDPGSALGAVRTASFLNKHRDFENSSADLLGAVCSNWDASGAAAREVAGALAGTDLVIFDTRIPYSRRVPAGTLAKRPVVLGAPNSRVADAYRELTDEVLTRYAKAKRLTS
jgi:chromosome partitioning protein